MKSFFRRVHVGIASALTAVSMNVFGWGNEGHRIIGLVADNMLTARARIELNALLSGGTLSDATTFVDAYHEALKREVPGSEKWHYDNIPVCGDFVPATHCVDGNCASAQVPRQLAIVADKTRSREDRLMALRFLVHLIGDIHQPLHAADDNDLGGNRKIVFLPTSTEPRNLHIVWDVDIVKLVLRGNSELEFARQLISTYRNDFANWLRGNSFQWTADSHLIAKRLVYGKLPGFTCGEVAGLKTGLLNGKPWGDTPLLLTEDYVKGATGVVPNLLARAGARLGGMLNSALDVEGAQAKRAALSGAKDASKAAPEPPKTESLQEALGRRSPPLPPLENNKSRLLAVVSKHICLKSSVNKRLLQNK